MNAATKKNSEIYIVMQTLINSDDYGNEGYGDRNDDEENVGGDDDEDNNFDDDGSGSDGGYNDDSDDAI
ncbi:hypothetical protein ElyMa_004555800 [Elysia marginata]|uniref:Uncharacterized protein n=1 Tax=Elysia marginata TaxID=1093978 RepID=A0AAV4HRC7_9GAST|nr:hypothetical protein ElyMa_004555800 [Elysia marginata]